MKRIIPVALVAVLALAMCAQSEEAEKSTESAVKEAVAEPAQVDFETPVVKLFAKRCAGCHGAEGGAAGLALVEKPVVKGALAAASSQIDTLKIVHPGNPEASYLIMKVRGAEGIEGKRMPPSGDGLSPEEMTAIEAWVGALCTPEEKAEKAKAEMKAKKEGAEKKGEEAVKEMKAEKEGAEKKGEEAVKEMKAEKEGAKEKGEEAAAEMKAKKEALKKKAEETAQEAEAEEEMEEAAAEETEEAAEEE